METSELLVALRRYYGDYIEPDFIDRLNTLVTACYYNRYGEYGMLYDITSKIQQQKQQKREVVK